MCRWGSLEMQQIRFRVALRAMPCMGKYVLDFGCGCCDMWLPVMRAGALRYVGVDILEGMQKEAFLRYPGVACACGDIIGVSLGEAEEMVGGKFDVGYALGSFSVEQGDNGAFLYRGVGRLLELCREGVVVDVLVGEGSRTDGRHYYTESELSALGALGMVEEVWGIPGHNRMFTVKPYG